MSDHTIIGSAFHSTRQLRSILARRPGGTADPSSEDQIAAPLFKIRAASSSGQRSSASILIERMYSWRGYQTTTDEAPQSDRVTLVASDHDETIGTMSIGFDGAAGLMVEDLFPLEVQALRDGGSRLCEFTKLAMDIERSSRRVLASLFHVAYIYAHRLHEYDCLLIEVNPRHVAYYSRMLGFRAIGEPRLNRRVNATAVLLCLQLSHAQDQIGKLGGQPKLAAGQRSLYPHMFSVDEEAGLVARLKRQRDEMASKDYHH